MDRIQALCQKVNKIKRKDGMLCGAVPRFMSLCTHNSQGWGIFQEMAFQPTTLRLSVLVYQE